MNMSLCAAGQIYCGKYIDDLLELELYSRRVKVPAMPPVHASLFAGVTINRQGFVSLPDYQTIWHRDAALRGGTGALEQRRS